jgi:amino acid transporter
MAYAFARDGGLPYSAVLRQVSPRFRTPAFAIWSVTAGATLFTLYAPVYTTITAVCTILLYVSYVLPTALGLVTYGGSWRHFGPFQLGRWYRPFAAASVLGCLGLIVIGMQPPNGKAAIVLASLSVGLALIWFGWLRRTFVGPPQQLLNAEADQ